MRVLMLGDIVGSPGRKAVETLVPKLRKSEKIGFVIANGENAAGGSGITPRIADELFASGVDVITSGDHIWNRREVAGYLDANDKLLRPANYPKGAYGFGHCVVEASGCKIGVINLSGRVFMDPIESPFRVAQEIISEIKPRTNNIFLDFHAEATSEKIAMGWFLDGEISCMAGTHTHVQTADEKVLPKGTAYITDLGMTGPHDGVIGRKKEQILSRFLTQLPTRFEMAEDDIQLQGALVDIDEKTGKARSITRIQKAL
ncbi:MAG: TIGR00282 family metallophosphoesterase [Candidatus Omnitrophota bacterium]